jgi:hypothetical protein
MGFAKWLNPSERSLLKLRSGNADVSQWEIIALEQ